MFYDINWGNKISGTQAIPIERVKKVSSWPESDHSIDICDNSPLEYDNRKVEMNWLQITSQTITPYLFEPYTGSAVNDIEN